MAKLSYLKIILFLIFVATNALADPTLDQINQANKEADRIQRNQIERIEQDLLEEKDKHPSTSIEYLPSPSNEPTDNNACRDIKELVIEGASILEDSKRVELTHAYTGRCLTASDIESLLTELTKYYIDRGYITVRVYIQAQDLTSGILRILVVEGEVEGLLLEGDSLDNNVNLKTAFPWVIGSALNLRDIEQGLDQINRLASNNATMNIKPGDKVGGSVVVVRNQPTRRLRGNLSADNYGSDTTGKEQVGLGFSYDNLLGLNDWLNFVHRRTTEADFSAQHSRSNSLIYSIPYGYLTFTAMHNWSDYATTIQLPGTSLVSSGDSKNSSLTVDYVAYRDAINRLSFSSSLTKKTTNNYLAGQLLTTSSRSLTVFDIGSTWNTRFLDGTLGVNLGYSRGLDWLGALQDRTDLPASFPHAQFGKWIGDLSWTKPFQLKEQNFVFSSQVNVQHGVDVLYGSEQFSIGSLYTVRGYRNVSIAGDRGFYWRNDLSMPFFSSIFGQATSIKPYAGYDVGVVQDRNQELGGRLTGIAMGVRANISQANVDLSVMKPLSMPDRLQDEGTQVFLKLSVNI